MAQQQQQRPLASQLMIAKSDYDPQIHSTYVNAENIEQSFRHKNIELCFRQGDIIRVYGPMDEDGFYLGELNFVRGLVPSNLLQPATTEISFINGT